MIQLSQVFEDTKKRSQNLDYLLQTLFRPEYRLSLSARQETDISADM